MDLKNNRTAVEILNQLGGNKFVAMTGSYNFLSGKDEGQEFLRMHLRKNKSKANRLQITLNAMDTYNVHFYRFWISAKTKEMNNDTVEYFENIYNDQLQEIFTRVTGLNTSL
jgi:hypothetical protein